MQSGLSAAAAIQSREGFRIRGQGPGLGVQSIRARLGNATPAAGCGAVCGPDGIS